MKIGQISFVYKPITGGQQVYIKNLNKVLIENGHSVTVYQPFWGVKANDIKALPRIPKIGRVIPYVDLYVFNLMLALHKKKYLEKEDLLIVHYAFHSLPVWNLEKKVIVLSHGVEWYPNNKTFNDYFHQLIAQNSFNRFKLVVNDTNYLRHLGLEVEPGKGFFQSVAPNKWFIPNCVDQYEFIRNEGIDTLKTRKVILVPRQVTPDRGIHLAILAFEKMNKKDKGYILLIVGNVPKGEEQYYKECQTLVNKLNLREKVFFHGNIDNSLMPYYYSSAQLTLIPTIRREGTSLSALESMACQTPTVSTNVEGLKDLPTIKTSIHPEAISEAMLETLNDRKNVSEFQYQKTTEIFTLKNWKRAWENVINCIN